MKSLYYMFISGLLVLTTTAANALESYSPRVDIEPKTIVIRGSDTLEVLLKDWVSDFSRYHPHVKFDMIAKGSSKAFKALLAKEADLGPMSRKMKRKESRAFRAEFGYRPTRVSVAVDALAVVVNPSNPLKKLSLEDLDSLFSSTNKCGGRKEVGTWGDLDVSGSIADKTPALISRNSSSGTYGFFKKRALCRGDYKETIVTQPTNEQILSAVEKDPLAIGYIGLGYLNKGVKALALPARYGSKYVAPVMNSAKMINYPLSRHLYIYMNLSPNDQLHAATAEFFRYIYSKQGQAIVTKKGFIALADYAVEANYSELNMK